MLGGASVADALLEPTVIYVRAVLELLRSDVDVRGLAHITGGGLLNLLRLHAAVGFEIDAPLPVPAIFDLVQEFADVGDAEMWEVFNMGCGFCAVVPAAQADAAVELLRRHHPGTARIGWVTGDADRVTVPALGLHLRRLVVDLGRALAGRAVVVVLVAGARARHAAVLLLLLPAVLRRLDVLGEAV